MVLKRDSMKLWVKENKKENKENKVEGSFSKKLMAPETIRKLVAVGLVSLAIWVAPFANCGGDSDTKTSKSDVYSDVKGGKDGGSNEEDIDKIVYYQTLPTRSRVDIFCYIEDDRDSLVNVVNSNYYKEKEWRGPQHKEEVAQMIKENWISIDPSKIIKVRLIAFNVKREYIKNKEIEKYQTEMETPLGKLSIKNEAYVLNYFEEFDDGKNRDYYVQVYSRDENGKLNEFEYSHLIYRSWSVKESEGMEFILMGENNEPPRYYAFPCFFGCIGEKKEEKITDEYGGQELKVTCEKAMIFEFRIMPDHGPHNMKPGDFQHEEICYDYCIENGKRGCTGDPMLCD